MTTVIDSVIRSKSFVTVATAMVLTISVPATSLASPNEALESNVKDCRFLGKVEGSSGYGKNMGWQSLAKSAALQRAEKIEASHLVWERFIPVGAFNGLAVARAYSCNS